MSVGVVCPRLFILESYKLCTYNILIGCYDVLHSAFENMSENPTRERSKVFTSGGLYKYST